MLPNFGAGRELDQPARILLVEDEVLIRTMLAEEMRFHDLSVVEASNADEAWNYLLAGGKADLVFSDIQMPGSMDGVELTEKIKTQYPEVKVILTSGNLGLRKIKDVSAFLPKPYQIAHAVELVLKSLHTR